MRAIGSERIQDPDKKLERILEIAGIKKGELNESSNLKGRMSNVLHEAVAVDGTEYAIVQESKYVYIKVKNGDTYDYITGVQNIHEHSYKSYADALKNLNLMFKSINEEYGHKENIDVLKKKDLTEKRFVLKQKKDDAQEVMPTDTNDGDTSDVDDQSISDLESELLGGGEGSSEGDGGEEDMDDVATDDSGGEELPTEPVQDEPQTGGAKNFRLVQKLTGKLGNELRNSPDMSTDNIKYVLNSIISAINVENLSPEDKDDIVNKIMGDGSDEEIEGGGDMEQELQENRLIVDVLAKLIR